MTQQVTTRAARRLEELDVLDGVSESVQGALRSAAERTPSLRDALNGTWLGHPLHPALTDVVVGAWSSALFLDYCGGWRGEEAADSVLAAGTVLAVPTAAAGLSDWLELRGERRRLGSIHALGNTTAVVLQALSVRERRRHRRGRGIALSTLAYGIASFSAWLGGHLAMDRAVGVNQAALEEPPEDWTAVAGEHELSERELVGVHAGDAAILLVRSEGRIHALADRCAHRGCSLHEGELRDDRIVCPCHGSTFRLDGSLVRGPAAFPQPSFETRVNDGRIEVRRPQAAET